MKKTTIAGVLGGMAVIVAAGIAARPQKNVTVEGYVLDSACAFTKGLEKPISRDCAVACAKEGSQLVILTAEGGVYRAIGFTTPAQGQKTKLLGVCGDRRRTTGEVQERGGA